MYKESDRKKDAARLKKNLNYTLDKIIPHYIDKS